MPFFKKLLRKAKKIVKNEVEKELKVDLDGDGNIGGSEVQNTTGNATKDTAGSSETFQYQTNGQQQNLVGETYEEFKSRGQGDFNVTWNSFQPKRSSPVKLGKMQVQVDSRRTTSGKGRYKSLLIGINYPGTKAELRGCVNDVDRMRQFLIEQGFTDTPESMVVLADDPNGMVGSRRTDGLPTKENILKGLQWLAQGCEEGDILFFHYSGHGAQQKDPDGAEEDGMNETVCPSDFQRNGMIADDELWDLLVWPLPSGVKLTALMDCCHSGTGLDIPHHHKIVKEHETKTKKLESKIEPNPSLAQADVTLFSGCADDETSLDSSSYSEEQKKRISSGAMTTAFLKAWKTFSQQGNPTYFDFLTEVHKNLDEAHPDKATGTQKPFPFLNIGGGKRQQPQLSATQSFDVYQRRFDLNGKTQDSILLNTNPDVGRLVKHHFHPKIDLGGTGLGDMLMEQIKKLAMEHGTKMVSEMMSSMMKK